MLLFGFIRYHMDLQLFLCAQRSLLVLEVMLCPTNGWVGRNSAAVVIRRAGGHHSELPCQEGHADGGCTGAAAVGSAVDHRHGAPHPGTGHVHPGASLHACKRLFASVAESLPFAAHCGSQAPSVSDRHPCACCDFWLWGRAQLGRAISRSQLNMATFWRRIQLERSNLLQSCRRRQI